MEGSVPPFLWRPKNARTEIHATRRNRYESECCSITIFRLGGSASISRRKTASIVSLQITRLPTPPAKTLLVHNRRDTEDAREWSPCCDWRSGGQRNFYTTNSTRKAIYSQRGQVPRYKFGATVVDTVMLSDTIISKHVLAALADCRSWPFTSITYRFYPAFVKANHQS